MKNKIIVAFLLLIVVAVGYSMAAEIFKDRTYPTTRGDRFFVSKAGAITATDADTMILTTTFTSPAFSTTWDHGNGPIPASQLWLFGSIIGYQTTATNYIDSLRILYWICSEADGDTGAFFGSDTVALDTTSMNFDTAGETMFFMHQLTPTDKKGNAFIPRRMFISTACIGLGASTDTVLVDDFGILMRYTD